MKIKSEETKDGVTTIETVSGHRIKMPEQNKIVELIQPQMTLSEIMNKLNELETKIDQLIGAVP